MAVLVLLATLALVAALDVWFVRRDGLGHREPPRSHAEWEAAGLPSRPYRSW